MDNIITVIIAVIGIGTSFLISFLMEKYGNKKRVKEIQDEINRINKEMIDATKKNDKVRLEKLEKEADKLPALMNESLILNLKGAAISLPIILAIPWIIQNLFANFIITLPFKLPTFSKTSSFEIVWRDTFGAYGWTLLSIIILGAILQMAYQQVKNIKNKNVNKENK